MQQPKEIVMAAFNKASEPIYNAISSIENSEIVFDISKRNNLSKEQFSAIGDETTLVMLGFTRPDDFVKSIMARTGLTETVTRSIAQEINERIFRPIRDELRNVHGMPTVTIKPPQPQGMATPAQAPKPVAPRANLPIAKPATQSMPTEGLVPLQKRPAPTTMADWQKNPIPQKEDPFRTMQKDSARALLEKQTRPAPFAHADEEGIMDKATLLKSIETPSPHVPLPSRPAETKPTTASPKPAMPLESATTMPQTNIMNDKLQGFTKMAKEEVHMTHEVVPDETPIKKERLDPYREPMQ